MGFHSGCFPEQHFAGITRHKSPPVTQRLAASVAPVTAELPTTALLISSGEFQEPTRTLRGLPVLIGTGRTLCRTLARANLTNGCL
jgi:hypothetical protein